MLRPGENILNFPSEHPVVDPAPFQGIKPLPGEYWVVMDPPRETMPVLGADGSVAGNIHLRAMGNGWDDKYAMEYDAAEKRWDDLQKEALEAIAIYRNDDKSFDAKRRAHMLAEAAMAAHDTWKQMRKPYEPGAALEQRADAYTVVKVGEYVDLEVGDRVIVAPYAARRIRSLFGVNDVGVVGKEDPWQDVTPLKLNRDTMEWDLIANWMIIGIYYYRSPVEMSKKLFKVNAGVVAKVGPEASFEEGDTVVLHKDRTVPRPDDTKWFVSRYCEWQAKHAVFVREVDSRGSRRVLASMSTVDVS